MEVEKDPWSYIWLQTTWWCKDPEHQQPWYLATRRPQYSCFSSTRVNDSALIQAPWIHDALKWAAGDAILSLKWNCDFFLKLRNQHFISLCKILKQKASWPYKLRCKTLYMYQYRPHSTIPICGYGQVIALVEILWNSLHTTIGACHGLLHSLKIYTTQTPFHYPNSGRTECLWNSLHRTIAKDQWLLNSLKHIQLFEFWPFWGTQNDL